MKRSELRAAAFARSDGRCEWPRCLSRPVELAHLHSIGMGGRASADVLSNVAALCSAHARVSDGQFPQGATRQRESYEAALEALPDVTTADVAKSGLAWRVAEGLRRSIAAKTSGER